MDGCNTAVPGTELLVPAADTRYGSGAAGAGRPWAGPAWYGVVCAGVAGLLFFAVSFGFRLLDGSWQGWLHSSSREQYQAAWLAFRQLPWTFPIGRIPLFFSPHGSSIAFMDGSPWYFTLLKLLGAALPDPFAAWGWWILLCCLLQGMTAYLLMCELSARRAARCTGTLLLTISPVVVAQSFHFTLLAHWVVLSAWYLFFVEERRPAAARWWWLALALFVAGTHPYLTAMIVPLRLASLWRVGQSRRRWVADAALTVAAAVLPFILFGYLANGATQDGGAERFEADLAAFVVPMGSSSIFPSPLDSSGEQEGYGYLGLGGLIAVGALAVSLARPSAVQGSLPRRQRTLTGLAVGALFLLFAFGPVLRLFGSALLTHRAVSNPFYRYLLTGSLKAIPRFFRAPGRFIWPLYYLLVAAGAQVISRSRLLCVAVLALQIVDIGPFMAARHSRFQSLPLPGLLRDAPTLREVRHSSRIEFIPLQPREACGLPPRPDILDSLKGMLLVSAELQIPMNSGLQARLPAQELQPLCEAQLRAFQTGQLQKDVVYIVENEFMPKDPALLSTLAWRTFQHFSVVTVQSEFLGRRLDRRTRRSPGLKDSSRHHHELMRGRSGPARE